MQNTITAIYCRVSKDDSHLEVSRSIENQVSVLTQYANENSMNIFKVYVDDGYSGKDINRPAIQQLLADMKKRKFNTIIFKDFSRLARNLYIASDLIQNTFPQNNMRVIALNDSYDSSTYNDDYSIIIRLFLNDYYLKQYSFKASMAVLKRAKTKNMSLRGAFGYMYDDNKNIVIDPEYYHIVQFIYHSYIDGLTTGDIAKELTKMKIPTPAYLKQLKYNNQYYPKEENQYNWYHKSVLKILSNYDYTGNSINRKKIKHKNQIITNLDPTILENTHEPIITIETFNKVKEIRERKSVKPLDIQERLLQFFKCKHCNNSLAYSKKDNPNYNCYRCVKCKISYKVDLMHEVIERDVKELLNLYKDNQDNFKNIIQKRINALPEQVRLKQLTNNQENIENKISNILDKYLNQDITEEEYNNHSKQLKEQYNENLAQIELFNECTTDAILFEDRYNQFIKDIHNSINTIDFFEMVKHLIKECIVERVDKTIKITIKYKCKLKLG
ncbi:MAG: recombinase family protein [bacterium]